MLEIRLPSHVYMFTELDSQRILRLKNDMHMSLEELNPMTDVICESRSFRLRKVPLNNTIFCTVFLLYGERIS